MPSAWRVSSSCCLKALWVRLSREHYLFSFCPFSGTVFLSPRPAPGFPCISRLIIRPRLSPLLTCTKISLQFIIYIAHERDAPAWGENLEAIKLRSIKVLNNTGNRNSFLSLWSKLQSNGIHLPCLGWSTTEFFAFAILNFCPKMTFTPPPSFSSSVSLQLLSSPWSTWFSTWFSTWYLVLALL